MPPLPGVQSVSASAQMPFRGFLPRTVLSNVDGKPIELRKRVGIAYSPISADYFQTLGVPLVERGVPHARGGRERRQGERVGHFERLEETTLIAATVGSSLENAAVQARSRMPTSRKAPSSSMTRRSPST